MSCKFTDFDQNVKLKRVVLFKLRHFTDFDQNVKLKQVVLFKLRHFCQKSYFESFLV